MINWQDVADKQEALEVAIVTLTEKLNDREADLINAKREERKLIVNTLERWRAFGTHLVSNEAIQALRDWE